MTLHTHTLYDMAEKNALAFGSAPCIVSGGAELSFARFLDRVNAAASHMASLGLSAGERVAIVSGNNPEYLIALVAASRLRALAVAVNWRLSAEEIGHVLSDTSPRLVLADAPRMSSLAGTMKSLGLPCPLVDLASLGEGRSCEALPEPPEGPSGDDPFLIIHTAAVSGKARGAVLSHHNMVLAALQSAARFQLSEKDACLGFLPFFHILQLVLTFAAMVAGGKNVVQEKFDPDDCLRQISAHRVSLMGSFPPILAEITKAAERAEEIPRSLRAVVGIDAPANIEPFQKIFATDFFLLYGQTETSGPVTLGPSRERPGSAGRPTALAMVKVVGECGIAPCKDNPGEIYIRGPLVFRGYWEGGKMDGPTFSDGWHKTGDLGYMDQAGYLFFAGRKPERELIKPGGENVFPAEVEAVLLSHEEVVEAVVIGVPDPRFGEAIRALCVKKEGSSLSEKELIEFVAGRIARYKKPREVIFVESLPRAAAGGVCRKTVKERYGAGQ
ncbi:MAG: AMP-binding protein [Thermodesulfobacteriota bacterium]